MPEALTIDELIAKLYLFKHQFGGNVPVFVNEPGKHDLDLSVLDVIPIRPGDQLIIRIIVHCNDPIKEGDDYEKRKKEGINTTQSVKGRARHPQGNRRIIY